MSNHIDNEFETSDADENIGIIKEENNSNVDNEHIASNLDYELLDSMSDDEAIIELDKITGENDKIVEQDYLSSLIEQDERLVYYEIENIYVDSKKRRYKNRLKLRKNPPVLIVRDDYDNEASFYLTENLTEELINTLNQVQRAYYGFDGPSDLDIPDKFIDKIGYYAKNNPFKLLLPILVIALIVMLIVK